MRTILALLLLAGCLARPPGSPHDRFFAQLSALCGKAFTGRLETSDPADTAFASQPLVMHVRDCRADEVRIPFHVGEDRSRTWIISRTADGLRLKHDHRHSDGSPDAQTQYGGDTVLPGSPGRQAFPADDYSKALFVRGGRQASIANVWATEIEPGVAFVYELARPGRLFRVRFDLTRPMPPPAPQVH